MTLYVLQLHRYLYTCDKSLAFRSIWMIKNKAIDTHSAIENNCIYMLLFPVHALHEQIKHVVV